MIVHHRWNTVWRRPETGKFPVWLEQRQCRLCGMTDVDIYLMEVKPAGPGFMVDIKPPRKEWTSWGCKGRRND